MRGANPVNLPEIDYRIATQKQQNAMNLIDDYFHRNRLEYDFQEAFGEINKVVELGEAYLKKSFSGFEALYDTGIFENEDFYWWYVKTA